MKTALLLLICLFLIVRAIACQCDLTINKSGIYKAQQYPVQPGQIICVQAGTYTYLRFQDMQGTAAAPIKIINCGGKVTVGDPANYGGIQFYNCLYFKLTGSGDSQTPYGFLINQSGGGSGLAITNKSSDSEVEQVEIMNMAFAGIMAKTDPTCDPTTQRGGFTMYNVNIHDNYIHDVYGEGIYVGNSFWSAGMNKTCDNTSQVIYPHDVIGLKIYNNLIERSGAEGIQYGCAPNAQVYRNTVRNPGASPFSTYQDNGIQIGEGSGGFFYGNIITNAASAGLIILGHTGNLIVYNNVIANSGSNGIFCDNRTGSSVNTPAGFLQNTIVTTGKEGIKLYNENNINTIVNNILVNIWQNRYIAFGQGATATQNNNLTNSSIAAAQFVNASGLNFQLTNTSPAVNAGMNLSSWGITTDLLGTSRPAANAYDIGAYEYVSSSAREASPFETKLSATSMLVYPTPCRGELTIQLPTEAQIKELLVYDLNGRLVQSHLYYTNLESTVTKDMTELPVGSYVLRVSLADQQVYTTRFVKM
ncbi:right-handed parallel beta-helix repeat-containing protein [Spirosoma foliorum]|uniref:Right-handed parallel beta-helix repeat-containing protein n=1 Tax=Spirosoma foliorum TaxID=2710596 RepID=A0A7G5H401_9BACT|nr:right-handed parallel beta-helix repeat-containing protein [Spirosoma foliorum]QMW05843.1 right-handed parallel beta-helix repeat-containing protein [Spirosoma foliorum]